MFDNTLPQMAGVLPVETVHFILDATDPLTPALGQDYGSNSPPPQPK